MTTAHTNQNSKKRPYSDWRNVNRLLLQTDRIRARQVTEVVIQVSVSRFLNLSNCILQIHPLNKQIYSALLWYSEMDNTGNWLNIYKYMQMIIFTVTFESYTDMTFQILTTMSNCKNAGWLFDIGHRVRCTVGHVWEAEISIGSVIIHEPFCAFLLQIWTCIKMHMQLSYSWEPLTLCVYVSHTIHFSHFWSNQVEYAN